MTARMDSLLEPLERGERRAALRAPVVLAVALDQSYDYLVPDGVELEPGTFVLVPFGPQSRIGVVWNCAVGDTGKAIDPKKLKTIAGPGCVSASSCGRCCQPCTCAAASRSGHPTPRGPEAGQTNHPRSGVQRHGQAELHHVTRQPEQLPQTDRRPRRRSGRRTPPPRVRGTLSTRRTALRALAADPRPPSRWARRSRRGPRTDGRPGFPHGLVQDRLGHVARPLEPVQTPIIARAAPARSLPGPVGPPR